MGKKLTALYEELYTTTRKHWLTTKKKYNIKKIEDISVPEFKEVVKVLRKIKKELDSDTK